MKSRCLCGTKTLLSLNTHVSEVLDHYGESLTVLHRLGIDCRDIFDRYIDGVLNVKCHGVVFALANVFSGKLCVTIHLLLTWQFSTLDHLQDVLAFRGRIKGATTEDTGELLAVLQRQCGILPLRLRQLDFDSGRLRTR